MSFRIDDLLKKESSRAHRKLSEDLIPELADAGFCSPTKRASSEEIYTEGSILQNSLLNRINPYFPYHALDSPSTGAYQACCGNSDKYCSLVQDLSSRSYRGYFDFNYESDTRYVSIYAKNQFFGTGIGTSPLLLRMCSKRKGGQIRFTSVQTDELEKRFTSHKYLSPEDRKILADSLKLSDKQVKTWFQNRRAKWRRYNSVSSAGTDSESERGESKIF